MTVYTREGLNLDQEVGSAIRKALNSEESLRSSTHGMTLVATAVDAMEKGATTIVLPLGYEVWLTGDEAEGEPEGVIGVFAFESDALAFAAAFNAMHADDPNHYEVRERAIPFNAA